MDHTKIASKIPKEVTHVTRTLEGAGFQAYLVGGCVRDLVMSKEPRDWDITTNATPADIQQLFDKTVYENRFGTVAVILEDVIHETLRQIEVTPYRIEAGYSDLRHPDKVEFSENIEDDLKRRDFTVNSLAIDSKGHLLDLYGGLKDIEAKTIRTVGEADERFREDALRMLRAIRLSVQLNFSISTETTESIIKNAPLVKSLSAERVRDELQKIILSVSPASGIVMLQKFGLLGSVIPELEEGIGCEQGGEHIYDVWEHLLQALQHAADKKWPLEVRLAALFHDIGKPRSRRASGDASVRVRTQPDASHKHPPSAPAPRKKQWTFYGHEVIGARMAKKIMERLKFPKKETELVEKLVRNHMFFSDTEQITLSAVRRIITKVGKENIWLLMNVRECDRVGMKKKEAPYRLRKYFAMIEEALRDPISVSQLKIDGNYLMKELNIPAGPRMGWILHALLEEVLEEPKKNTVEILSARAGELNKLSDKELRALGEQAKEKKEDLDAEEVEKLHSKHGVRKGN